MRRNMRAAIWVVVVSCLAAGGCADPDVAEDLFGDEPYIEKTITDFVADPTMPGEEPLGLYGPDGRKRDWAAGRDRINDIAVIDGGFVTATGSGVARFRWSGRSAALVAEYREADGLPSDKTYVVLEDADGGLWALCAGGVGHLPRGGKRWQAWRPERDLPAGVVTDLKLGPKRRRVWMTTTHGLATADIRQRAWRVHPVHNPLEIFPTPDGKGVWCRHLISHEDPGGCDCIGNGVLSYFDLAKGTFRGIIDDEDLHGPSVDLLHIEADTGRLWLMRHETPYVYDPRTNKRTSWPASQNWQYTDDGRTYTSQFGRPPHVDSTGRIWFATDRGLWRYDPRQQVWKGFLRSEYPDALPMVTASLDGRALYLGGVAAFDVETETWSDLPDVDSVVAGAAGYGTGGESQVSPDGKYIWGRTDNFVFAQPVNLTNPSDADDAEENDTTAINKVRLIRMAPQARSVLLGTPQGVFLCDYDGAVRGCARRGSCTFAYRPVKIGVTTDGRQVWVLQDEGFRMSYPSVAILHTRTGTWERYVEPGARRECYDFALSPDGKTAWAWIGESCYSVKPMERTLPDGPWRPATSAPAGSREDLRRQQAKTLEQITERIEELTGDCVTSCTLPDENGDVTCTILPLRGVKAHESSPGLTVSRVHLESGKVTTLCDTRWSPRCLAVGNDGAIWAGCDGCVVRIDPTTGATKVFD